MTEKTNIATLPTQGKSFSLTPQTLDEAMKYAEIIAKSDIVPKDYKNNAGNVLVAVQMGAELGLPPLQALQNIAVINGRPCVWGDSLIAIARAHPACEYINESFDDKNATAICIVKRKGEPEQKRTFSQEDAVTAGLWGKQGPWKTNPKRMLQMRARGFAIRDVFADALRGLAVAEEVRDYERDVTPREADAPKPPASYPPAEFEANLPKWKGAIQSGKKTADDLIAMIETRAPLTEAQKDTIRKLQPIEGEVE